MQEWLGNKKNLPIVVGLFGVIMVAVIVFILFQTGVLGGTSAATDASASAPAAPAVAPGPTPPPVAAPPAAPGAPVAAASGVPGAAAPTKVAAVPVVGAPGARPDPFAGYVDYSTYMANIRKNLPPPPRVDSYVPFVRITNYVPATGQVQPLRPGGIPNLPTGIGTSVASIGRVSGVMLTNGAFAIVDNQGQSSILQPGDQLPNGGGRVISIQADGITVHSGDQTIKVPISAGDSTNTPGGPNGPNGPFGPQGPPNIPGNAPDQGDNTNGG